MLKLNSALIGLFLFTLSAQTPGKLNIGRIAVEKDIAARDKFITPEGNGLPAGRGTALEGKLIFERRCAKCHGQKGEGADDPALAGGVGSLGQPKELRTVGSYWPHAPGVWDYVNRAMPFKDPGSLTADQTYAVVAYVLYLNKLFDEGEELNAKSLVKIKMPNKDGFIKDPRPDVKRSAK